MKKKSLALLLAMGIVFGSAIGGSLAWLIDTSDTVTNTFAPSNIEIVLNESKLKDDGTLDKADKVTTNTNYKMVPGVALPKDPAVTVEKGSEACWLFIKVEEVGVTGSVNGESVTYDLDDFLTYTINTSNWTQLDGVQGVYYYTGSKDLENQVNADKTIHILTNDQVRVNTTVTKEMMDNLVAVGKKPELKFTAYASQYSNGTGNFTVREAWNNINQ